LKYGAFFDTENGPGLIADFKRRNWLGGARILGVSTRYDSDLQEFRTYFSQPPISFLPFKTNLTGFKRRELEEVFITDRTGVSIQQEAGLGNRFVLSFGYSVDRARTYDRYEPPPDDFLALPFDVTLNIARLSGTVSRDTRDDVLDATRGSFTSHAVEYGAEALGSDLALFKYFGQVFRYFPLSSPAEIPFSGGVSRPRLVYATGLRVGLLTPLGNNSVTPPNERFRAGGGTTVRGFLEDHLGPVDFSGDRSGNAVLIANNELRFPMVSIFDGVGFLDAGNVYERVGDFSLSDLRATAGFGVRVRTSYFLLRADYGFKLDRRVDEKAGTLFFSIGQAF
jgi:outer membrane protein assembly factor BamA